MPDRLDFETKPEVGATKFGLWRHLSGPSKGYLQQAHRKSTATRSRTRAEAWVSAQMRSLVKMCDRWIANKSLICKNEARGRQQFKIEQKAPLLGSRKLSPGKGFQTIIAKHYLMAQQGWDSHFGDTGGSQQTRGKDLRRLRTRG